MNLLPHKRTLCLSNLTGSLSRLLSSTTGVKCQCFLFHQCFILGLYFNKGNEIAIQMSLQIYFCPFLILYLCYVNLNNLSFIFNLYKSFGEMCYSCAIRHNSCADITPKPRSKPLSQPKRSFYHLFFQSKIPDFIVCRAVVPKVYYVEH